MLPGVGVAGQNGIRDRLPGESFVQGTNAWGNELTNKNHNFVTDVFPGREGGFFSVLANLIPGQNAFSYLHDSWGANDSLLDIPFAQLTTYGAYVRSLMPFIKEGL